MHARVHYAEVQNMIAIYQERGERAATELAPVIADALVSQVLEVFDTEGFGGWPRFAHERDGRPPPNTRRFRGGGAKLLQDTGNLVGSITPDWEEHVIEAFTNVPYAKYHASPRPREKIPLRDFFDIDHEAFEEDIVSMLETHLTRPLAAE